MEASEKKVSTRVRGAAWRRKDAPKARGVSFPGRHEGVEELKEMEKKRDRSTPERMPAGIGREKQQKKEAYASSIFTPHPVL